MSDLLKLAERVEAATGPDRELDCEIHCAIDPSGHRKRAFNTIGVFGPSYTASIDAAMSLVPDGWHSCRIGNTDDHRGYAHLAGNDGHMMAEDPDEFYVEAEAATPALALTAAALRARAVQP